MMKKAIIRWLGAFRHESNLTPLEQIEREFNCSKECERAAESLWGEYWQSQIHPERAAFGVLFGRESVVRHFFRDVASNTPSSEDGVRRLHGNNVKEQHRSPHNEIWVNGACKGIVLRQFIRLTDVNIYANARGYDKSFVTWYKLSDIRKVLKFAKANNIPMYINASGSFAKKHNLRAGLELEPDKWGVFPIAYYEVSNLIKARELYNSQAPEREKRVKEKRVLLAKQQEELFFD